MIKQKQNKFIPPIAKQLITKSTFHGDERIDKYAWLKTDTKEDQGVINYLTEENNYANSVLKSSMELKEKLYEEIIFYTSNVENEDEVIITEKNGYFYYTKNVENKDHPVYCRKKGSLEADEEVYFDLNQYAEDYEYYNIGLQKVSPDQTLLAFTVDTTGAERYKLYILNLADGKLLHETIEGVDYLEWANDSKTFFYAQDDGEEKRPCRLRKHLIGTEVINDQLLFEEIDYEFEIEIKKSKNEEYIFLFTEKEGVAEYYFIDANKPDTGLTLITSREMKIDVSVQTAGNNFFIMLFDESSPNGKLLKTDIGNFDIENWLEVIPHRQEVILAWEFDVLENCLIFSERNIEFGIKRIGIVKLDSNEIDYIKFPEELNVPQFEPNYSFNSDKIGVSYSSLTTPETYYNYNIKTAKLELLKQETIPNYIPSLYEAKRLWAQSKDDINVPFSIVYKKDMLKLDGTNPVYIYAYGSFGYIVEPGFYANMLPLLNRGVIFVIAHVRGSSFLGNKWHHDGRRLKRKNKAFDFIAVTDFLIKNNYTNKDKIIASGGSAGGELMLVVSNMRPDLFKVVIADVPGGDLLNKMLDPTLGGVIFHYEEIGNPEIKENYEYIKSYCPYQNIESKTYPNMFLRASLFDSRTFYWETAKFTAKMRECKKGNSINIMKTAMIGGHSGNGDWYKNRAEEYAFALKILDINK